LSRKGEGEGDENREGGCIRVPDLRVKKLVKRV